MGKYLPDIFDEQLYSDFPLHEYKYTRYCTLNCNRTQFKNIGGVTFIKQNEKFEVFQWSIENTLALDLIYIEMFSAKHLSPNILRTPYFSVGTAVRDHILKGDVQDGIDFIQMIPIFRKKIIESDFDYWMARKRNPLSLSNSNEKSSYDSDHSLRGRSDLDYTIKFFLAEMFYAHKIRYDFFGFTTGFAISECLAISLKSEFTDLAFDPILMK